MKKILILLFILSLCLCACNKGETPKEEPTDSNTSSEVTPTQGENPETEDPVTNNPTPEDPVTDEPATENPETEDPTPDDPVTDDPETEDPVVEMDVPVLIIDEETGVVTWEIIEGATHYNFIINDGEISSTTSTTITLTNESNISVQAASDDVTSDWSKAVTYFDTSDIEVTPNEKVYVYFYDTNLETLTVNAGDTIAKPADPTKANCEFDNWYSDPFGQNVFDFNQPILSNTIVYAKYNPTNLIDDVYFWVKASPKIYSNLQSSTTSSTGWRFIPLQVNSGQTGYKEFVATVTVTGASTASPAEFIVMDGFDDTAGRTYWKKGDVNFTIKSDGVYNIYFSTEHQYAQGIHIYVTAANNASNSTINQLMKKALDTPIVSVDSKSNIASWKSVKGALKYEVILNNGNVLETNELSVSIPKNTHITVRAVGINEVSNWSVPKANRGYVVNEEEITKAYVYFDGYDSIEVDINSTVNAPNEPVKAGYTFGGWYLDINYKTAVSFPYTVIGNTVFYPKWNSDSDYETREYYQLVDASGNKICGLTWNLDNFDYDEYQTPKVILKSATNYFVKSLDGMKSWGPYSVSTEGTYTIYFSEDFVWNNGTEHASNVYIASEKITIYFSNNKGWDKVYIYMWNSSSGTPAVSWPGSEMKYVKTNEYGEKIYSMTVDLGLYDYIIFTNNSGQQTKNISLKGVANNTGYYLTGSNKYDVATYEYK